MIFILFHLLPPHNQCHTLVGLCVNLAEPKSSQSSGLHTQSCSCDFLDSTGHCESFSLGIKWHDGMKIEGMKPSKEIKWMLLLVVGTLYYLRDAGNTLKMSYENYFVMVVGVC